ncbi:hypothetical protein AwEntero_29890 [Enterobacterales bacterium]|nr:hypothetical protein AwEntero_29890 [Enterobacterales bacterium]
MKKQVNRYFHNIPTVRLIVTVETVETDIVAQVDDLIGARRYGEITHPAMRNRAELVRLTIAEKLARDVRK